jgi:hypothetical protein
MYRTRVRPGLFHHDGAETVISMGDVLFGGGLEILDF